jgi:hypothetical protein
MAHIFFIKANAMNDTTADSENNGQARPELPDRLSVNPRSPHYVEQIFQYDVGIKLNGKERFDVEEYCISEGWVKAAAAKALDRRGQPLLMTLKGKVEAFYR